MTGIIKCFNRKCSYWDDEDSACCTKPLTQIQQCPQAIIHRYSEPRTYYAKELASNECACGDDKRKGYSFCFTCYKSLPKDMQTGLYQKIGQGYEETYEEAVNYLTMNIW